MLPKKNLRSKTKEIRQLQARLGEKQRAYQGILQEIRDQYKRKARQPSDEEFDETGLADLKKQSENLAYEASGIEAAILDCEREALEFAQKETDSISGEIERLQAVSIKNKQALMLELVETLERALILNYRLSGHYGRLSRLSDLKFVSMPEDLVRQSSERFQVSFLKNQLKADDPYAVSLQIQELKSKLSAGPQGLVNAALAESA
jgi:small-conductance mechanosensitive channel